MADNTASNSTAATNAAITTTSENVTPLPYAAALSGTEATAHQIVNASHSHMSAGELPQPYENIALNDAITDPAHMMNNLNVSSGMPMQAPANAAASALNGGARVDTSVAALNISKPAAGHTETVSVQPGQSIATNFDPNSADLHMRGQNLVMDFKDGSHIVLDHFAADTHNMPNIILPNGSLVAGGIIVAQLEGTDANLFNLQTAAGGIADAGGGQFQYSDNFGSVIALLNKLPPIGFTALTFGQPDPRVVTSNALIVNAPPPVSDNAGGTFTTTITTVITPPTSGTPGTPGNPTPGTNPDLGGLLGPVSGGFEDWQPYKNIGDHTQEPAALNITFTPSDNEVVDTVTISNFSAGTQFFFGAPGGTFVLIPNVGGSVTFTGAQLASNNIFILPPTQNDKDIPMTITLNIHDPDNGLTAVISQNTVAVIDAVADQPTTTSSVSIGAATDVGHVISAGEHQPITMNVTATFPDNDGSEAHTIILSGVPSEWTPTGGTLVMGGVIFVASTAPDGTITYTATVTGNVSGSVTFDPHNFSSAHSGGDAHLVLTVRTVESVTDGELTTANNTAEVVTPFTVNITEDIPTIITPPGTPGSSVPGSAANPVSISEDTLLVPGVDTANGTIVVDNHHDVPGTVTLNTTGLTALGLTSHGQTLTYAVSADGKTITATDTSGHTVFTVGLNTDTTSGTQQTTPYTFTLLQALDHPAANGANVIDIPVQFTAKDSDGDSATGSFHLGVVDGLPTVAVSQISTDETNPLGTTLNGTVNVAFGPDGAGTIAATSAFASSGSQLNGALSSHGVAVTVSYDAATNLYIGKAGAVTVFTMQINANGTYTFVQSQVLDHADGHNPNDAIDLNFGYKATDFDGDSATGNVTVHVIDDAPIAAPDVNFVPNGSTTAVGNVLNNDTLSHDAPTLLLLATVNGTTKDFAHPDGTDAGGAYINLTGTYGVLHLYQNGAYTYTYDTANHNGTFTEKFDYTIVDYDGDTSNTADVSGLNSGLTITIVDNGPGTAPAIQASVDETNLGTSISGTITPAAPLHGYALSAGFADSGSETAGHLTSHGVAVTVALVGGQYVGTANGANVFTLTLNANGSYTFVQTAVIDHADGANPNDVIDLKFNYTASDANNETVPGTITVHVVDDAPVAVNDTNFIPNGSTVATGNVLTNDILSHDAPTLLQSATVNGTTKDFAHADGSDANGAYINLTGTYGTLHLYQNGSYTYTYDTTNHNGILTEKFDYTIVDYDGDTSSTANQSGLVITITDNGPGTAPSIEAIVDETTLGTAATGTITPAVPLHDYALSAGFAASGSETAGALTSHGAAVTVALVGGQYVGTANGVTVFTLTLNANGSYNFVQTGVLDHADGTNPNDVIDLKFNYTAHDANNESVAGSITVHVRDDAPVAVADTNAVQNGGSVATGNVISNDVLSHDAPNTLKNVSFAGTTVAFAAPSGTDAGGKFVTLHGTYGDLKIYENGNYAYTYDTAHNTGNHTEQFGYTLVDFDGDTSSTSGQIAGQGLTITITDGAPTASPTYVGVDETDTLGKVFSGSFNSSFGPDGAGNVVANNSFNAIGSLSNNALTSHGVAVTVALAGGVYTGTAGGVTVFTMTVNSNGTYSFTQFQPLDHADGHNINDAIDLNFGYRVTDVDGDTADSIITVRVLDDAPIAIADTNAIPNGGTVATGNVIFNDVLSHDAPNLLQSVSFAGTTVSFATPTGVDAGGKYINLTGTYGMIHIYENGNYTYTYDTANHTGTNVEQFGYTIVDYDGDTSTTSGQVSGQGLTITIVDNGPGVAPTVTKEVDETTLNTSISGSVTAVDATHYNLTPGFTSGGSQTGGHLTSNGQPVTVTLTGNQYVGMAGSTVVFILTLNNDGTYNFVQKAPLDHADGNNPNDVISLNFSYLASDNDGDTSLGHIVVNVLDDAPLAVADINALTSTGPGVTASGNVINNDTLSHDTPNTLQSVAGANGVVHDFAHANGTDSIGKYVLVDGTYGQVKIYDNGQYTYTYTFAGHTGNHTEQFTYTLQDSDGDHSSTTLTINITDAYNAPPTLNIVGSSNNDALFDVQKLTVGHDLLPTFYELNNINCTPAQFAVLANNASNLLKLDFPTVLTVDIQHNIQQHDAQNGLGAFMIDASGHISNVQLLFGNTGDTPFGTNNQATYDTSGGTGKVVFFILTDGFSALQAAGLAGVDGNALHPANISLSMMQQSDGSYKLGYVDAGGALHTVGNSVYTSDVTLNGDGQVHAVAGVYADTPEGTAVYAFEDANGPYDYYGSDRDFNDVIFSVSAQPLVNVHYDSSHQLFDTLSIMDSDSALMHEALVEIRDPHAGDAIAFDFTGTAYTMSGDHIFKNGVDTGITATIATIAGKIDVHLIGDSATSSYNDILKTLHFNVGGDPLASNGQRTIDVTITDDHHQSSTLTTTYNVNLQTDPSMPSTPATGGTLTGTAKDDILVGHQGNDILNGGAGHDTLIAGSGNNTLTGGTGADSFMFLHGQTGVSTIMDYHKYEGDRIDVRDLLSGSNYTPGVSHVENFVKIDSNTGNVYVDSHGTGNFSEANHIATINNIFSVEAVNVLLNDHEGNKVVHTV